MNILLTNYCNGRCPYCFAANVMSDGKMQKEFSMDNLKTLLNYMYASSPNTPIHLLGGEPTLHSRLEEVINLILDRGFKKIVFFSNGIISPQKRVLLKRYLSSISFIWNINPPGLYQTQLQRLIHQSIADLANESNALGFNINSSAFDPSYIWDFLKEHTYLSLLRIGIAHPMGFSNEHQLENVITLKDYSAVGNILYDFIKKTLKKYPRVKKIGFDCGFTPCLFTPKQREYLQNDIFDFNLFDSVCSPSLTDISPDLSIKPCFARAYGTEKYTLTDFQNVFQAREYNAARWHFSLQNLPYAHRKCSTCVFRVNCGGCGGERIINARSQIKTFHNQIKKLDAGSSQKIKKMYSMAKLLAGSYDYSGAINIISDIEKECHFVRTKLSQRQQGVLLRSLKLKNTISSLENLDLYRDVGPEIDYGNMLLSQIRTTEKRFLLKPTNINLETYTKLIIAVVFRLKLKEKVQISHYKKNTRLLKNRLNIAVTNYLQITKKYACSFEQVQYAVWYAKILKRFKTVSVSKRYLALYFRLHKSSIKSQI